MLLRQGDRGHHVTAMQTDLNRHGADIIADGIFGPATAAAVRRFQREQGLVIDGIAGPKTLSALHGPRDPKALRQIDLVGAADTLGVDLAAVMAVNEVESRGRGFHIGGSYHGQPVILFERHIMRRRLEHHGIPAGEWISKRPDIVNSRPGGYIGGTAEHGRMMRAAQIHPDAATESASWGLFQIMGFHWERLGYASAQAWAAAMSKDEAAQLEAFVRFIESDRAIHAALKRQDWADFAHRYNGPNYAINDYDTKLAAAYRRHARQLETAA